MKRFLGALAITLGVLAALGTIFFLGIGYYLSPQSNLKSADAIVAVSGGDTAARTTEAVKLYQDGLAPLIIFSGAALDPTGPSNAAAMAATARRAGVPASAIELDETSGNTRQNAANVAEIIQAKELDSIILVTSPYHQRRAYIAFQHVLGKDFTILNHSSIDAEWRRSHWWATPTSRALTLAELQKVTYELASGQSK